ncbi:DUF4124 domain-containing protein, partial [Tahibacter caeni]|uniref:DUF4124 domain-containing protein n=1 Tax=Tahibacter caeni TaxID=1453545 RepID=UPI002148C387
MAESAAKEAKHCGSRRAPQARPRSIVGAMIPLPRLILIAVAALSAGPLAAEIKTAYRCTDEHGAIAFQDKPCRNDQKSQSFEYERAPPPPVDAEAPAQEPVAAAPPAPEPR